jgi:GNAT superfamily N-acetyltransferase
MADPQPILRASVREVSVGPLEERDLDAADHVFRLAFGTFLGLPDPLAFYASADLVRTRWFAEPAAAFGAESGGELIGSVFAANWGSVSFFGPLTVRPDFWDRGIGKLLLEPVMELFSRWNTQHAGLFTFAQSPKHISLYQRFGFWPRYLTAIMSKPVGNVRSAPKYLCYSEMQQNGREGFQRDHRELTGAILPGLDVDREIRAVHSQRLGDTLLLTGDEGLEAFAVCHCGKGTEAGEGVCYLKFAAVRPGPDAPQVFARLLQSCEGFAAARGLSRVAAGANLGRHEAYRRMMEAGFRTDMQGVAMQRPNEAGYNRSDVYLVDDWR